MSTAKSLHDLVLDKVNRLLAEYKPQLNRAVGTLPPGNTTPPGRMPNGGYVPADGSVTDEKIAPGAVTLSKLSFDPATQAELNDHAATRGAGDFGHVKPDGTTIVSAGGVLSVSESATGSTTLLGLSDVDDSYTGHAGHLLRVKSAETGVEFVAETVRTTTILMVTPGNTGTRLWSNMPAAKTEIFGASDHRLSLELAPWTQTRLQARMVSGGAAGSTFRVEYSSDGGSNWNYLDGTSGPQVAISASGSLLIGSWVTLSAGARTGDVLLRIVGLGGDGVLDPGVGQVWLQFK